MMQGRPGGKDGSVGYFVCHLLINTFLGFNGCVETGDEGLSS